MLDATQFSTAFGLDAGEVQSVLETPVTEGHAAPWYVQAILGLGAWITAIVMIVLGGVFLNLVFGVDEPGVAVLLLGLIYFGLGFALHLKGPANNFLSHFAVALTAAGVALVVADIGFETEDLWIAALASLPFAGLIAWKSPNPILQALVSTLGVFLAAAGLLEDVPYFLDILSLAMVAGVVLATRPLRRDLFPTALALILIGPLLSGALGGEFRFFFWSDVLAGGWGARAVHIGLFFWLLKTLWDHRPTARRELAAFAVAATLVCLLLPPGGSGALVIMTLAFMLGSRPLAVLGALLQIYFLWQFYYDLGISLLDKSLILMAAGAVVLLLWGLVVWAWKKEPAP